MGQHTRIIDLSGIPACGKSTLTSSFLYSGNHQTQYGSHHLGFDEYKESSWYKQLKCQNLFALISVLKFVNIFPYDGRHKRLGILNIYKLIVLNNFYRKYSRYDYIILEHGFIQCLVTWLWGKNFNDIPKLTNRIKDMAKYFSGTQYVFCKVEIKEAIHRIEKRGRNVGRFDRIVKTEHYKLQESYIEEEKRFSLIIEILRTIGIQVETIDMSSSVDTIKQDLIKICGIS